MASDKEFKVSTMIGCLFGMLSLFLVAPMWYAMLFGILQSIDAKPWMWVIYFIYVPSGIVVSSLEKIYKAMQREGD